MKRFFQILTIILALMAVIQVVTSRPSARAEAPEHDHDGPGI